MFQDSPDSPHVKQNLISIITNLVYKVPQELPNDLKIRNLGSTGNISDLETQPSAQCHFQKLNQLKSTQKQIANFSSSVQCPWMSLLCPKYFAQEDSKVFQLCPMLLNFFTLSGMLSPGLQILIILTKQLNITFNNYNFTSRYFSPSFHQRGGGQRRQGMGVKLPPSLSLSVICKIYVRNFKTVTKVEAHLRLQKMYILHSRPSIIDKFTGFSMECFMVDFYG